jgi:acetyl esterase/lipase
VLEDRYLLATQSIGGFYSPAAVEGLSREAATGGLDVSGKVRRLTLTYARGLAADLFYPANFRTGTGLLPTIAFFHGGGLSAGNPSFWFSGATYFAERGFLAVSFQYRLAGPAGAAQSVADARTALRWLRANAVPFGINPNAVVAAGDSAGGYLALLTALADNQPDETDLGAAVRPNAIVTFYPILDGSRIGVPASLSPAALAQSRPLPPTLIVQGTRDGLTATTYAVAANFASLANVLLLPFPGRDHAFMGSGNDSLIGLLVMEQYIRGIGLAGPG